MASETGLNPSKKDKEKGGTVIATATAMANAIGDIVGAGDKRVALPLPSTISATGPGPTGEPLKNPKSYRTSEFMDTIQKVRGVAAVMMMDKEGKVGSSNFDKVTSGMYCGLASQILQSTLPLIQALSPKNRLHVIRSNGGGQELIIAPISNHDLTFVIVQNCADHESIASNSLKPPEGKRGHKGTHWGTTTTEPHGPRASTAPTGGVMSSSASATSASAQNQNQNQPSHNASASAMKNS